MGTLLGYKGTMSRVDLTARAIAEESIGAETARAFIGGAGYGARVLHDEVPGDTDPFGPKTKLIFRPRPLTGTVFPTTSRYEVCTPHGRRLTGG